MDRMSEMHGAGVQGFHGTPDSYSSYDNQLDNNAQNNGEIYIF
jgi:hypothetical protein